MSSEVNQLLNLVETGDPKAAQELLPLVYEELRRLAGKKMAGERPGQTLQATALVHEAYIRLAGTEKEWEGKAHFFRVAAECMRRILIDRARKRAVRKASGLADPELLEESRIECEAPANEILALNEVLDRLETVDSDAAQLIKLRYFVGLTMIQAAETMGMSVRSAERLWTFARARLRMSLFWQMRECQAL